MPHPPSRLPLISYPCLLKLQKDGRELKSIELSLPQPIEISLSYENDKLVDIKFTSRGKIGQDLDLLLTNLGIKLTRAIQNRDPETGKEL